MKKQHNFDSFDSAFREAGENLRIKPGSESWNTIDRALSRRKRRSVYSIISIAATVLLLAGFFGFQFLNNSTYENPNYRVEQLNFNENTYDMALKDWIMFNRNS